MRGQTIAQLFVAILFTAFLTACGGGGPQFCTTNCGPSSSSGGTSSSSSSSGGSSSGSSSGTTMPTAAHIILSSNSPTLSSNPGAATSTVTLTATVTDANNVSIPGYTVAFAANGGVLTPAGTLTDTTGNITASLSAGSSAPGATITVSATASPLAAVSVPVKVASTTPSYSLGSLSPTNVFTPGVIAIGQSPLAAGGSSGLQVAIVDTANGNTPFTGTASVTFTSPCQSQSLASIVSPVASNSGTVASSYKATGCSGNDLITANATVNGSVISATGTINVQPATLGSISFVSATPATIGLKGTGLNESSTVVFAVVDKNGNPVQNQQVDFSSTTTAGGLGLSPANAKSDINGLVQTTVQSGTVHTSVRVKAVINGTTLATQSSVLTVSTGLPDQNGFSLAATTVNLIGDNFDGNTSQVTARLSDRYGNPVPDGTAVSFTTECGGIDQSCTTVNGACNVTFTTKNPRTRDLAFPAKGSTPASRTFLDNGCAVSSLGGVAFDGNLGCDDHRCTVTAYALGEESFNDCNGTGLYVSKDNTSNNPTQCPNGDFFVSKGEVFRDYSESGVFNGDFEPFIDFNNNGKWDAPSGKFIGLLCNDPDCDTTQTTLNISQSLVIVMSNSNLFVFVDTVPPPAINVHNYVAPPSKSSLTMSLGHTLTVYVSVGDTALQAPAAGTVISASMSNGGTVLVPNSTTVLNVNDFGYVTYAFVLQAPNTSTTGVDSLVISATTPAFGGNPASTSSVSIPVAYVAPTVSFDSNALTFPDTTVGVTSPAQTITVTNTGNTTLTFNGITISGTNGGDFAVSNNTCASVAAGGSCHFDVTFKPKAVGARSANLFFRSNAQSSPDKITLTGNGI